MIHGVFWTATQSRDKAYDDAHFDDSKKTHEFSSENAHF